MAHKCTVLGMLLSLHSLGIIFASLFTYKWYVDSSKDVGIFGICEYFNSTYVDGLIMSSNSATNSNNNIAKSIDNAAAAAAAISNANNLTYKVNAVFDALHAYSELKSAVYTTNLPVAAALVAEEVSAQQSNLFDVQTLQSQSSSQLTQRKSPNVKQQRRIKTSPAINEPFDTLNGETIYQKCYQLLWPNTDEAFEYLSSNYSLNVISFFLMMFLNFVFFLCSSFAALSFFASKTSFSNFHDGCCNIISLSWRAYSSVVIYLHHIYKCGLASTSWRAFTHSLNFNW
jgi:hypothetical protein